MKLHDQREKKNGQQKLEQKVNRNFRINHFTSSNKNHKNKRAPAKYRGADSKKQVLPATDASEERTNTDVNC